MHHDLSSVEFVIHATYAKLFSFPFVCRLGSLMEFMCFEQRTAFIAAFQDIYGLDLSKTLKGPFLEGSVHHGEFYLTVVLHYFIGCLHQH